MAETLTAGLTREQAHALLCEHNKDPFHIEHGETVEGVMRYFASEFDPENEEFLGVVGLLHDLDWEEHSDERISTPSMRRAHRGRRRNARAGPRHPNACVRLQLESPPPRVADGKDPVRLRGAHWPHRRGSGDASLQEHHGFQREVAEEEIQGQALRGWREPRHHPRSAEMLDWELDELFARTIEAMQSFAPDRDTFGKDA